MVVTTQFSTWASETDTARERPDVLALSTSGELVVIELKRGSDRNVHLQAITYGALVAGGYQPGQGLDGRRCDPKAGDVDPRPNSAAALGEGTRQELDTLRFAERDFKRAGVVMPSFSAADAWSYNGECLYVIASAAIDGN